MKTNFKIIKNGPEYVPVLLDYLFNDAEITLSLNGSILESVAHDNSYFLAVYSKV